MPSKHHPHPNSTDDVLYTVGDDDRIMMDMDCNCERILPDLYAASSSASILSAAAAAAAEAEAVAVETGGRSGRGGRGGKYRIEPAPEVGADTLSAAATTPSAAAMISPALLPSSFPSTALFPSEYLQQQQQYQYQYQHEQQQQQQHQYPQLLRSYSASIGSSWNTNSMHQDQHQQSKPQHYPQDYQQHYEQEPPQPIPPLRRSYSAAALYPSNYFNSNSLFYNSSRELSSVTSTASLPLPTRPASSFASASSSPAASSSMMAPPVLKSSSSAPVILEHPPLPQSTTGTAATATTVATSLSAPSLASTFVVTTAATTDLPTTTKTKTKTTAKTKSRRSTTTALPKTTRRGTRTKQRLTTTTQKSRRLKSSFWQEQFQELIRFREQHDHCFVPHQYPENPKLSQWVRRQRHQRKLKEKGLHSTLIDERETMLTNAGFIWSAHEALWQEKYQRLESYRQQHGHCDVPSNYHDTSFMNWVKNQRRQYKQIVLLRMTTRSHDQHKNENDNNTNSKTPSSSHQRSHANNDTRNNTLNPKRIELLNLIGFDWNPRRHGYANKATLQNNNKNGNSNI